MRDDIICSSETYVRGKGELEKPLNIPYMNVQGLDHTEKDKSNNILDADFTESVNCDSR